MMKWEICHRQYESGSRLFLGKWEVGTTHYDSCWTKNDPFAYIAACNLPRIKSRLDNYKTEEEAKKRVERAVKYWIEKAELRELKS